MRASKRRAHRCGCVDLGNTQSAGVFACSRRCPGCRPTGPPAGRARRSPAVPGFLWLLQPRHTELRGPRSSNFHHRTIPHHQRLAKRGPKAGRSSLKALAQKAHWRAEKQSSAARAGAPPPPTQQPPARLAWQQRLVIGHAQMFPFERRRSAPAPWRRP